MQPKSEENGTRHQIQVYPKIKMQQETVIPKYQGSVFKLRKESSTKSSKSQQQQDFSNANKILVMQS